MMQNHPPDQQPFTPNSPSSALTSVPMQYIQCRNDQYHHNNMIGNDHFRQIPAINQHHQNQHRFAQQQQQQQQHHQQQASSDDPLHQIQSHNQMRTKQSCFHQNYNQQRLKQLANFAVAQRKHYQDNLVYGHHQVQAWQDRQRHYDQDVNQSLVVLASSTPRARVASVSGAVCAPTAQVSPRPTSTSPSFKRSSSFSAPMSQQNSRTEPYWTPSGHLMNTSYDTNDNLSNNHNNLQPHYTTSYLQPTTGYQAAAYNSSSRLNGADQLQENSLSPLTSASSPASSSSLSMSASSTGFSCQQAHSPTYSTAGSSMSPSDALSLGINLEQYISKRNERERSRVRNVNDAFDNLKKSLPLEVERLTKRMSKVEILRTAINYIRNLEDMLGCSKQEQHETGGLIEEDQAQGESVNDLALANSKGSCINNNNNNELALFSSNNCYPDESLSKLQLLTGKSSDFATLNTTSNIIYNNLTYDASETNTSQYCSQTSYAETGLHEASASKTIRDNNHEMAVKERSLQETNWQSFDKGERRTSFNCSTVYQDDRLRNHYDGYYHEQHAFQSSH